MDASKVKKVCFLVNYNQYETKRYFTKKFSEAMIRAGIESRIYDVAETKNYENLVESIQEFQPDFTLSFNSSLPLLDNIYLWDRLKIPHLSILLDPSLYSVNLINSPYSIISCVDHFDCYGLSTQNFDRVFFMPHAIERDLFEKETLNKEYDIVFIGSYYDYKTLRKNWENELSEEESLIILKAVEMILSQKEISLQVALMRMWKESKLPQEGINFLKLFTYIDKYSRGLARVNLIKSIKNHTIHIFGAPIENDLPSVMNWEDVLQSQSNVVIHKSITYSESLEILRKSKISLNSSPHFKDGSHERIFSSFAANALTITNETLYTDREFPNEKRIVYSNDSEIESKIDFFLKNDMERQRLVLKYKEIILKNHTWDNRVSLLREIMPIMISNTKPFRKL